MAILSISISLPAPPHTLSSLSSFSGQNDVAFLRMMRYPQLSLTKFPLAPFKTTPVRMGGGPRTFPGGVSKWQWKRMQAKKAKQLLKARLARERQIYEMRKRAELKAAVSELERPWEVVEKAPNLFSVTADEQVKVLADRFQKPGGFDMWSDRDGPELFKLGGEIPSARYFPKGVVHSTKPYGKVENSGGEADPNVVLEGETVLSSKIRRLPSECSKGNGLKSKARDANNSNRRSSLNRANSAQFGKVENLGGEADPNGLLEGETVLSSKIRRLPSVCSKGNGLKSKARDANNSNRRSSLNRANSAQFGFATRENERSKRNEEGDRGGRSRNSVRISNNSKAEVFDLTLHKDGSYELDEEKRM